MKRIITIPVFLFILCLVNFKSYGQQTLELKPYAGTSMPLGEFQKFSKIGVSSGLSGDYFFTPNFGLGFDVNHQLNGFKSPYDFSRIPADNPMDTSDTWEVVNTQKGSFSSTSFSIGPSFRFGFGPTYRGTPSKKKKTVQDDGFGPTYRPLSANKDDGFGPTYRIFALSFNAKVGANLLSTPTVNYVFNRNNALGQFSQKQDLFVMDKQNVVSLMVTSGIRFNYNVNEKLSLFVNPQYTYTTAKVNYTYTDIEPAWVTNIHGDEEFSSGMLIDQEEQTDQFKTSYFNVNAGLSFNIGTKKKSIKGEGFGPTYRPLSAKEDDGFGPTYRPLSVEEGEGFGPTYRPLSVEESEGFGPTYRNINIQECFPVELIKKEEQITYNLDNKDRPDFTWEENPLNKTAPEKYILRLMNDKNEVVYTEETTKKKAAHNDRLETIYQEYTKDSKKMMYWDVESQYKDCGSQTSETKSFSLKRSGGLDLNLQNIQCESPAFDKEGFVHYTAEVVVENSANNDMSVNIPQQAFQFSDPTVQNSSVQNGTIITCDNGNTTQFPIVLNPGDSKVICVSFKRPFGETDTRLELDYFKANYSSDLLPETAYGRLPNCICNVCNDWTFEEGGENVVALSENSSKLRLTTNLLIGNSDLIQKVSTQIVSVRQMTNNEECYSCTTEESEMLLLTKGNSLPTAYWENHGIGQTYERNENDLGNILNWNAKSPGADFTMPIQFQFDFMIPERSTLSCCNSSYVVCIRYTVTNINCETCTYLTCYEINPDKIEVLDASPTNNNVVK